MSDLIERVSNSRIISDFNGVVVRSTIFKTVYVGAVFAFRNPITLPRIIQLGVLRSYELALNSKVDEERILRKKVSLIRNVPVGEFERLALNSNPFDINADFVNFIVCMKKDLGVDRITIPVITRDSGDYLTYWLENTRTMQLHDNTPSGFLELYGIRLEIIANSFRVENGYYNGEIEPGEKSRILFPVDPLITIDKREKYMIGDKPRIILVDAEEYAHLSHLGYDKKMLYLINLQDKIRLDERVKKAVDFLEL